MKPPTAQTKVDQYADKMQASLGKFAHRAGDLGRRAADSNLGDRIKDPPLIDPIRYRQILVTVLKLLAAFELATAFLQGMEGKGWMRFGVDLVVAGILFLLWERITLLLRERKAISRRQIEANPNTIRLWDALIFSLLWSDEIMRDIPKDRSRLVVISYTLITFGVVAAFVQIGSGLMPLVITGGLVMAAVNLVIWVVSLERGEKESLQTELRLAHDVQMSLMPKSHPQIPGFDIAAIAQPAREVGGDLFEYTRMGDEDGRLGVGVSDVSGKGLQAALSAVFTSGAFATEVRRTISPAEILTRMNRVVYSHSRRGQFVAFLLAVLDSSAHMVVFANAGQTKPLLLTSDAIQWVDSVGVHFPLGMQPESAYEERTISVRSGDILLLMTDGITDAMNADREPFGAERIEQFLTQPGRSSLSAQDLVDQLAAAVRLHVGEAPEHDDMTLVAVKVL